MPFEKHEMVQLSAKSVFALQLPMSSSEFFPKMLLVFSIDLFHSTNELQEIY